MRHRSIVRGGLGEDLSALESIELLLVEVSLPVVVNLVGITEEGVSDGVAHAVTKEASAGKKGPLTSSQLSILKVSQNLGSNNKEGSEGDTNNTHLSKQTKSTTLSSEEVILGEKMSLWLINDLIGGPRLITGLVEES